jgi:Fic family protein
MVKLLAETERQIGELAGVGRMLPNPYLLVGPAIRREAVLSSRIEGTISGMEDLFFFEADQTAQLNKNDVREVHNYVLALEYGLERVAELPVSLRLLCELHERLMQGVRREQATPGIFRTSQNWIGRPGCTLNEATYVPPPPEMLLEVLGDWKKFIHAENELPDLIRLAMIHYQFEAIHPFIDGNGRIGRLLIVLLLCTWGILPQPLLYLSAFFERYRDDYYRLLLKVSQQGAWEEWIEFFLSGMRTQAIDALMVGKSLLALQQQYHALFAIKPPTRILHPVVDRLLMNPVMSISTLRDVYQVDFNTARKTIDALVQAGIAREITGQQRNRLWVATDILQLISEKRADKA